MELLRGLRPQALQAGAQVVAINCLQLPTPQHVFSRLWEKLSGQHLGPARWVATDTPAQALNVTGLTSPPICVPFSSCMFWLHTGEPWTVMWPMWLLCADVGLCGCCVLPFDRGLLWCCRACEALMQSFGISGSGASRRRNYSTIIVLDEIDMLMTRDQAVSACCLQNQL